MGFINEQCVLWQMGQMDMENPIISVGYFNSIIVFWNIYWVLKKEGTPSFFNVYFSNGFALIVW